VGPASCAEKKNVTPPPMEREGFSRATGTVLALACLTRYEAWPVTAVALTLAAWSRWRSGETARDALASVARIAALPALAIVGFAIFSRVVIGEWFVSSDFFVPENKAIGDLWGVMKEIGWGVETLSSPALVWLGGAGCVLLAVLGLASRQRVSAAIALALIATAAIPVAAFYKGHPFRIRYMVPLIAMEAVGVGALVGIVRRAEIPA